MARQGLYRVLLLIMLLLSGSVFSQSQPQPQQKPDFHPVTGPGDIPLGDHLATLKLPASLIYLNKDDTMKLFQMLKEPTNGNELGVVVEKGSNWMALYRYVALGYIKDDEADKLNADDLLKVIRKNTDEDNKKRKELGSPPLSVVGWDQAPSYDRSQHTLTWSLVAQEQNAANQVVNYTSVVLGRHGVLTCTLVDDYKNVAGLKPKLATLATAVGFAPGNDYASWVKGDKVSSISMRNLITGGSAAAALYAAGKVGLLAKLGKLLLVAVLVLKKGIIVVIVALLALFKGLWNKLRGKTVG